MDELSAANRVLGIGSAPASLIREIERTARRPILAESIEISPASVARARRIPGRGDPNRPKWVDMDYLPRVRPHRFKVPYLEHARATRGYPFELGMQTLMQESLTFSWPWRTIGRVTTGSPSNFSMPTGYGTGVMVGPNLMLTASHVAPWNGGWMLFTPGFRDGVGDPRFGSAYVNRYRGIRPSGSPNGYDYVICRLAAPIGNNTGWMGYAWWTGEGPYYNGTWFLNGFPGTFHGGARLAVEFPIKIDDIDNDAPGLELEFGFYPVGGWSGGPLWGYVEGGPRVVGVMSGWEYDVYDPLRCVISAGWLMADLIGYGWANWV